MKFLPLNAHWKPKLFNFRNGPDMTLDVYRGRKTTMQPQQQQQNSILGLLTLKAPNKNCSRRHFNFFILSLEENKA